MADGHRTGWQYLYQYKQSSCTRFRGWHNGFISVCFYDQPRKIMAQTLYDKLWDAHVIEQHEDGTCLLYIDRHLLHEVTSPQAFEGLALADRQPWRGRAHRAVADHNLPPT